MRRCEYKLVSASESNLRCLLQWVAARDIVWMTYRFPLQKKVTITYPTSCIDPAESQQIDHEIMHARQFASWWGPWLIPLAVTLFPLPVFFSGRWYVERWPYWHDIVDNKLSVEQAVWKLWLRYGWCWPKCLMRRWFYKKLLEDLK